MLKGILPNANSREIIIPQAGRFIYVYTPEVSYCRRRSTQFSGRQFAARGGYGLTPNYFHRLARSVIIVMWHAALIERCRSRQVCHRACTPMGAGYVLGDAGHQADAMRRTRN